MRIIAAYLLAVLGGNATPGKADIKKILDSVGISADDAMLDKALAGLKDKDLDELIAAGSEKLASCGGAGGGGGGGGAAAEAAPEPEPEPEPEEEEDEDMGFSLFD